MTLRRTVSCTLTAVSMLIGSAAQRSSGGEALKRIEYRQTLMGVPVRILVYSAQESLANAAAHSAFDRIRQLNLVFSDYDDDSEASRLCQSARPGRPAAVSPDLAEVLDRSLELARQSGGAFDVTIGPLSQLWRKARRTGRLPAAAAIAEARARVGYGLVHFDRTRRTVELARPGMRLDFGGIVKGFAADEARAVLAARGCPRALVALAGDLSVGDPPPGRPGWRIAVQGLEPADAAPRQFVLLKNQCVSTAGDLFQFVEIDGVRYSHLIDPKTGLGLTRRVSVTVIAPRGITADGLDSAAAILGPQQGLKLIEAAPGACGQFVEQTPSGVKTLQTAGFAKYVLDRPPGANP